MELTEKQVERLSDLYSDLAMVNDLLAASKLKGMTWSLSAVDKKWNVSGSITVHKLLALGVLDSIFAAKRTQSRGMRGLTESAG